MFGLLDFIILTRAQYFDNTRFVILHWQAPMGSRKRFAKKANK